MKKITFLFFLFIFKLSLGQTDLFVSNNPNTYIYVDGNGFTDGTGVAPLYVTNTIDLDGTNSTIYLRNEAQLLQGGVSSNNSGQGQLSVYQRGTVSQYNYNYWCSPVGNTITDTSSNTAFIPNNNLYGRVGTSPTASNVASFTNAYNGTANPFIISSRWIYSYNPGSEYSDWDYINQNGSVPSGYGFTMKGVSGTDGSNNTGNNQLYDFRGKPNSGEIPVAVLGPVGGEPQFTLTGNPYPSALDARDFFHMDSENQAVLAGTGSGALLFWEQNSASHVLADYVGGYGIYTIDNSGVVSYTAAPYSTYDGAGNVTGSLGGSSPNNNPGVNAPGRYLPVGQGFMVEGATDGNIYFRNSYREFHKESSGNSHFFRNSDLSSSENDVPSNNETFLPDEYMRFRIAFDIEHNSDFFSRELLVNMVDYATEDYDYGMEAKLPEILPSDAHFNCNGVPFGIVAVPFFLERTIPITAIVDHQQLITFRAYDIQNIPDSIPVFLHDIDNDVYINLRIQDYSINLDSGIYANRFEITFTTGSSLDTPDISATDFTIFQDNTRSQLSILNPQGLDIKSLFLYDIAGKQVIKVSQLPIDSEYHFSTNALSDGIYIASIDFGNNQTLSKKVIVKNK